MLRFVLYVNNKSTFLLVHGYFQFNVLVTSSLFKNYLVFESLSLFKLSLSGIVLLVLVKSNLLVFSLSLGSPVFESHSIFKLSF